MHPHNTGYHYTDTIPFPAAIRTRVKLLSEPHAPPPPPPLSNPSSSPNYLDWKTKTNLQNLLTLSSCRHAHLLQSLQVCLQRHQTQTC